MFFYLHKILSFKLLKVTLKLCCMFAGQHEPNLCAVPLKLNSTMFALVTRLNAYQEIKKNDFKKLF